MTFLSKKFYTFFFVCLSILLWGCTEDTSEDFILDPDSELLHGLFPNDQAQNDSAAANLAHGIYLIVHPQAKYQLSFDVDPNYDAPELQLFRIYTEKSSKKNIYQQVRALEPQIVNNRYVYEFICEENEAIRWATSLVLDENYYPGKTSNIRLTGEGAFSDHFSINLIVVGNIEDEVKEDNDGFTIKEFAANLLSSFRKYYSSVTIDTLYLKFAHEHPTLGTKYPKDEPWIADPNSEDIMLSELGGWPGSESALDIVLVHHIKSEGILGTSGLFSGNMGGGYGSTVLLGTHVITPYGTQQNESMKNIIETAIHETGHFFGLRHTTSSSEDLGKTIYDTHIGDYSNIEDGLDDTPYCAQAQRHGLLKSSANDLHYPSNLYRIQFIEKTGSISLRDCPDANNMMFAAEIDHQNLILSEQQLKIIRKSLMIYPH